MNIRKLKFDTPKLVLALAALVCACIAISILGFKIKWDVWPQPVDILMGLTLLAPFAIPKSFADTLGITSLNSTRGTIPMAIAYWTITLTLLWYTVRSRLIIAFVLLALICLTASWNWQVVVTGMMGI